MDRISIHCEITEFNEDIDVCGCYNIKKHCFDEDNYRGTLTFNGNIGKKYYVSVPMLHQGPSNPAYVMYSARLESFEKFSWPGDHPIKPEIFARAGFYYQG